MKRGKKGGRDISNKELVMASDDSQTYARVVKMLGNNRVSARFADGSERTCRIRGSMRRREWINAGDLVLVSLRDELSGDTADIIHKYQHTDAQKLRRLGEPVHIKTTDDETLDDDLVAFDDGDMAVNVVNDDANVAGVAGPVNDDLDWEHI